MRRLRFIPALLVILTACSENVIEKAPVESEVMGTVAIALSTDLQNEVVGTKAEADEPDLDDFRVAIYKVATQMRLYNDSYANSVGKTIPLNAGEYRLIAQHGDTLGCGFNKPYYLADKTFTVEGGSNTVEAVARLANVKLAVDYDATISQNYSDYYAIIRHNRIKGKNIKFNKNENRNGYIPAGELVLEVYADVNGKGDWKYFKTEPMTYNPNDFVTFEITTDAREGSLVINITVDSSVEDKEEVVEIPAIMVPQDAPSITLAGFDDIGNTHLLIEGQPAEGHSAMASFIARGSLAHCYLTVNSSFLTAKGIPAEIDFTDLDASLASTLRSAGFGWDETMATSRTYSYIDFSKVITSMLSSVKASAFDVTLADFSLRVVDSVGKEITEEFKIVSGAVKVSLEVLEHNVWARKVVSPVVTISQGVPSCVVLQYSVNGGSVWNDLEVNPELKGYVLDYGTVPVEPATNYSLRAIYNGNEECISPVRAFTTEAALQIGNSGFEGYQLVQTDFTPAGGAFGGGTYTRNWYLPYASGETDIWWACNSLQSMPDGHTGWTGTWCKNFPTSGYVKDSRSGTKAAMLYNVNVGDGNTNEVASGTVYEGELWIGTADSSGGHASDGHSFASRPSKLAFYYKYSPNGSDKFYVDAWIQATDGTVIATLNEPSGGSADVWTRYEKAFTYSAIDKKAAKIYVLFRSCNGNGTVKTKTDFDLGEESVRAHAGSFLKIDDIELIYE